MLPVAAENLANQSWNSLSGTRRNPNTRVRSPSCPHSMTCCQWAQEAWEGGEWGVREGVDGGGGNAVTHKSHSAVSECSAPECPYLHGAGVHIPRFIGPQPGHKLAVRAFCVQVDHALPLQFADEEGRREGAGY